jgi:HSP20 family protein
MDRLFEDFFGTSPGDSNQRRVLPTYFLPLDVTDAEGGYQIEAPVPGFKPEEVEVTFADGVLRIQAQHSQESAQNKGGYLRKEVAYGNYQRSIQLPADVKEDDIQAHFENGVLTITVPKVPRPQPKKIQVASGSQRQLGGKTT